MRKCFIIIVFLVFLVPLSARGKVWLGNFSVGLGGVTNFKKGSEIKELSDNTFFKRVTPVFDLGLYSRTGSSTIIGLNYNLALDYHIEDSVDGISGDYREYHSLLGLSLIHFLGDDLGQGFYGRFDLGAANLITSGTEVESKASQWGTNGLGALLGAGLVLDFGSSRINLSFSYSYRWLYESGDFDYLFESHIIGFSTGLLW